VFLLNNSLTFSGKPIGSEEFLTGWLKLSDELSGFVNEFFTLVMNEMLKKRI